MTIHFIYSKEALLVKERLEELRKKYGYSPRDAVQMEAENLSFERLEERLRGTDLFSTRTWLEIRGAVEFSKLDETAAKPLINVLKKTPEDAVVILYQEGAVEPIRGLKVDRFMTLATALKDKAVKHDLKPPDERAVPGWVERRAKGRGLDVTPTVAEAIVDRVGTTLDALENAIQILDIAKTGSRKVTTSDLQYLPQSAEVEVWDILNELWAGRADKGIEILRRLETQNESPERVLGGLAVGVRQVIRAEGRPLASWEARRFGSALRSLNAGRFREILRLVGQADVRLKTTNEPGFGILEELVLRISALRSEGT